LLQSNSEEIERISFVQHFEPKSNPDMLYTNYVSLIAQAPLFVLKQAHFFVARCWKRETLPPASRCSLMLSTIM
jgi:hypothetical protein